MSAEARSQFDVFQPTTVLAGQELTKQLESRIGATLENQPGVASRSFGPATTRVRSFEVSTAIACRFCRMASARAICRASLPTTPSRVNPAAAERIEVVRGPATLLYGSNAIGGLVNIITDEIPTRAVQGTSGDVTFDVGTGARKPAAPADVRVGNGKFAVSMRRRRPPLRRFRTRPTARSSTRSRAAPSATSAPHGPATRRYVGASYGYDDTKSASRSSKGAPAVDAAQAQRHGPRGARAT